MFNRILSFFPQQIKINTNTRLGSQVGHGIGFLIGFGYGAYLSYNNWWDPDNQFDLKNNFEEFASEFLYHLVVHMGGAAWVASKGSETIGIIVGALSSFQFNLDNQDNVDKLLRQFPQAWKQTVLMLLNDDNHRFVQKKMF